MEAAASGRALLNHGVDPVGEGFGRGGGEAQLEAEEGVQRLVDDVGQLHRRPGQSDRQAPVNERAARPGEVLSGRLQLRRGQLVSVKERAAGANDEATSHIQGESDRRR